MLPLRLIHLRQVVARDGRRAVFRPELFFKNPECALQDRLGVGEASLILIDHSNIVQTLGCLAMVRAEHLLADFPCPLMKRFGLRCV